MVRLQAHARGAPGGERRASEADPEEGAVRRGVVQYGRGRGGVRPLRREAGGVLQEAAVGRLGVVVGSGTRGHAGAAVARGGARRRTPREKNQKIKV